MPCPAAPIGAGVAPRVTEVGTARQPHREPHDVRMVVPSCLDVGGDASLPDAGLPWARLALPHVVPAAPHSAAISGRPASMTVSPRTPERGGSLMYYLSYYLIVEVGVYNLLLSVMAC